MSGVVPRTREVVALGSRYMEAVVGCGMVDTGTTLAVLSGSSQSGGREELPQQQVWVVLSLTSSTTNRKRRRAEETKTRVMLRRLRGGPEGNEAELGKPS